MAGGSVYQSVSFFFFSLSCVSRAIQGAANWRSGTIICTSNYEAYGPPNRTYLSKKKRLSKILQNVTLYCRRVGLMIECKVYCCCKAGISVIYKTSLLKVR